jgi:hypothetical protein
MWAENITPSLPPTVELVVSAYIGVIDWVGEIEWVEVQIPNTLTKGYVGLRDGSTVLAQTSCNAASLPAPSKPNYPKVSAGDFAFTPAYPIFGRTTSGYDIPAAYMGACGLHRTYCDSGDGSKVDLVPSNLEFCIDTRNRNNLDQCDSLLSRPIPVYAPIDGVLKTFADKTFAVEMIEPIIIINNNVATEVYRQVHFTHAILNSNLSEGTPVTAGSLLGYLCKNSDKDKCKIAKDVPTHLALQLRYRPKNSVTSIQLYAPANQAVIGFVAQPTCLENTWTDNGGGVPNRNPNTSTAFRACS